MEPETTAGVALGGTLALTGLVIYISMKLRERALAKRFVIPAYELWDDKWSRFSQADFIAGYLQANWKRATVIVRDIHNHQMAEIVYHNRIRAGFSVGGRNFEMNNTTRYTKAEVREAHPSSPSTTSLGVYSGGGLTVSDGTFTFTETNTSTFEIRPASVLGSEIQLLQDGLQIGLVESRRGVVVGLIPQSLSPVARLFIFAVCYSRFRV